MSTEPGCFYTNVHSSRRSCELLAMSMMSSCPSCFPTRRTPSLSLPCTENWPASLWSKAESLVRLCFSWWPEQIWQVFFCVVCDVAYVFFSASASSRWTENLRGHSQLNASDLGRRSWERQKVHHHLQARGWRLERGNPHAEKFFKPLKFWPTWHLKWHSSCEMLKNY